MGIGIKDRPTEKEGDIKKRLESAAQALMRRLMGVISAGL